MNTLVENMRAIDQATQLRFAFLELCRLGGIVKDFKSGKKQPSILLAQPLDCIETTPITIGEKNFAQGEHNGCRVLWEIAEVTA